MQVSLHDIPQLTSYRFFDQEAFSDVTIKFGTRERKCHKMILCSKSGYFNDLCGPGKHFAEAQQRTVVLNEDDEDAFEAMLRWIYTFDYEDRISEAKVEATLDFHLNVCIVADKYLLSDLMNEALSRIRTKLETVEESELIRVIGKVRENKESSIFPQSVHDIANEVTDARLHVLVQNPEFRELMKHDNELCMETMDKVLDEKLRGFASVVEERSWFSCTGCKRTALMPAFWQPGNYKCGNPRCTRMLTAAEHQVVWAKKN